MSEWQPIETAPKDGTYVLILDATPHHRDGWVVRVCAYRAFSDRDCRSGGGEWEEWGPGMASYATHWMPLPQPPT